MKTIKSLLCIMILFFNCCVLQVNAESFGEVPKQLDNSTQFEWEVLKYTNIERANAGLPLLVSFDRMQLMAGIRAEEIVEQFSHYRYDEDDEELVLYNTIFKENKFSAGLSAENIARGQTSPKEAVIGWMNSPGHKANILKSDLRYMGAGHYKSGNMDHWVQLFAGSGVAECVGIDYYEKQGYFAIKLKSGITAYAPYHPTSSPTINGEVTFNFPGAENVLINYVDGMPEEIEKELPTETTLPQITKQANPTSSKVFLNNRLQVLEAYNIDDNNYFKLRDLAFILNGSAKQFEVGYNQRTSAVTIQTLKPYTIVGGEVAFADKLQKNAVLNNAKVFINDKEVQMTAYLINDNNFFKLRDLMKNIDVYVGYDEETQNITLDTNKGYL